MKGIIKSFIFIVLVIYQPICGACFCDSFDCRPLNWNPAGNGWASLNESSRSSTIYGNGTHNTSIIVNDPCNIRFNWEISRGYNELIFLDNDNYSGIFIPAQLNGPHPLINRPVTYSINDNIPHELKWVHKNPHSEGTASITDIRICDMVNFRNIKVNPTIGPSGPSGVNFTYSMEVDSPLPAFDVELFVIPPNTSLSNEVSLGVRKYSQSDRLLKWGPAKLNCTNFGNGTYLFRVGPPINGFSKSYDGPYVPVCIIPNSYPNRCNGSVCTYGYCIDVFSCIDATVELFVSDPGAPKTSLGPKPINASDNCQLICWNDTHEWTFAEYGVK